MKGLGLLLLIAGMVVLALGIYGFITMSSSEISAQWADRAIDMFTALGGNSLLTSGQAFELTVARNRVLLTAIGGAFTLIGVLLQRRRAA